jgi:hypothetical protein
MSDEEDVVALEQNLTDIEGLVDQILALLVAKDALAADLTAQIAALVQAANIAADAKAALATKIAAVTAKSVAAEDKLRSVIPLVPPVGGTPLSPSYANQADFDAGVAAYTGPEAVTQDGTEKKAGTTPSIDYFTHSADGSISTSGPTD